MRPGTSRADLQFFDHRFTSTPSQPNRTSIGSPPTGSPAVIRLIVGAAHDKKEWLCVGEFERQLSGDHRRRDRGCGDRDRLLWGPRRWRPPESDAWRES